jgi:hypothetical protein
MLVLNKSIAIDIGTANILSIFVYKSSIIIV